MARSKKSLLMNAGFQLKLLGYFLVLSLITMTIFYASVRFFFLEFYNKGIELGLPADHVFYRFLADQKAKMDIIFVFTSLFSTLSLVIGGLVLSHKIAGPVHRLCHWLDKMAKGGDYQKLSFRDGDFFPEIPEKLNKCFESRNDDSDKVA